MKLCEDCLVEKPEEDFYHHVRTGPAPICKPCTVKAQRIRRQDPEGYKALVVERRRRRRVVLVPDHKVCPRCSEDKLLSAYREKARGLYGRSSWCRECEAACGKAYANGPKREELLKRRQETWAANPLTDEQRQEAVARARAWYAENTERHARGCSARHAMNAGQNRARARAWAQAHPERVRENSRRWCFEHPERARRGVTMTLLKEQWSLVLEVFDRRCAYCLKPSEPLTVDHIIALSRGGDHTIENVVPACKSCNSKKHNRPVWSMLNM